MAMAEYASLGHNGGSSSSGAARSSTSTPLAYPSVHLESFTSLSAVAPSSSGSSPPFTLRGQGQGASQGLYNNDVDNALEGGSRKLSVPHLKIDVPPLPSNPGQKQGSSGFNRSSPGRSPTRPAGPMPPRLPPPTIALPPVPTLSPISPICIGSIATSPVSTSGPGVGAGAEGRKASSPLPSPSQSQSAASGLGSSSGSAIGGSRIRPLGPSLTIHVPQHQLQGPRSPIASSSSRALPPLKDATGIPRRRTIVESPRAMAADLVDETGATDYMSGGNARPASGSGSGSGLLRGERKSSLPTLEAKLSPSSPTFRRSLPRPPDPTGTSSPSANVTTATVVAPSNSWPKPKPSTTTPAATKPNHQANKSASNLPVVSGLADAGPYPTTPRMSGVGLGRPPDRTSGAKPGIAPYEEVCLECMMRDRDLADVDVSGKRAWERSSDADFEELRWREETLLKSLGGEASFLEGPESSESEHTSPSYPSGPLEDAQSRRGIAEKNHKLEMERAKRRHADERVAREIGWRAFRWEEGRQGSGFPRGFRGARGGKLTEDGIKAVMTRFPKASEHRYEYLHTYLVNQSKSVHELYLQAQQVGHYPFPEEPTYAETASSHEGAILAGPRTSSISWEQQYAPRQGSSTPGGLQPMRPSPSTPAELGSARIKPLIQRPATQLYPESGGAGLTPAAQTIKARYERGISVSSTLDQSARYEKWADDEDLWSPASAAGGGAGDTGSIRPFSFAVRAGATAARDGSDGGHGGRKSMFGRWGGSVTSFFGGSQGGSGSMMDMHLGLDSDRRAAATMPDFPRAVSLASPSRPSFFSSSSSEQVPTQAQTYAQTPRRGSRQVSKSLSSSRLSQVVQHDPDDDPPPLPTSTSTSTSKKGIKGLLQKMKHKSKQHLKNDPTSNRNSAESRPKTYTDLNDPLKPPPNMAYLAADGQRRNTNHSRNGSASSGSGFTDSQASGSINGYKSNSYGPGGGSGFRSVSAPIGTGTASSGGSVGNSPTSSRYAGGFKRESVNSIGGPRASSDLDGIGFQGQNQNQGQGQAQGQGQMQGQNRGSTLEVLSTGLGNTRLDGDASYTQDSFGRNAANSNTNIVSGGYPQPQPQAAQSSYRNSRYTIASLSNSSGLAPSLSLETPPMPSVNTSSSFFATNNNGNNNGSSNNSYGSGSPIVPSHSSTNSLSPNRFKNLPPIPPPGPVDFTAGALPDSKMYDHDYAHGKMFGNDDRNMEYTPRAKMQTKASANANAPTNGSMMTPSPSSMSFPQPTHLNTSLSATATSTNSRPFDSQSSSPYTQSRQQQAQYHAHGQTPQAPPRASYDPYSRPTPTSNSIPGSTARAGGGGGDSPRMAQSMYAQPSAAGSSSSFARFLKGYGQMDPNQGQKQGQAQYLHQQQQQQQHEYEYRSERNGPPQHRQQEQQHQHRPDDRYSQAQPLYHQPIQGDGPGQGQGQGQGQGAGVAPEKKGRARSSTLSKGFKGIFGGAKNGRLA